MLRSLQIYAWIAALGVLLHLATAGAGVWCKAMGLMSASCCPAEASESPLLAAPSDCCRPALEAVDAGLGEPLFEHAPVLAALPWGAVVVEEPRLGPSRPEPQARAAAPPLALLASIVIIR